MDCQGRPVLVSGPERQVANGFSYYCKCSDLEAGQSEEKLKNEGKKKIEFEGRVPLRLLLLCSKFILKYIIVFLGVCETECVLDPILSSGHQHSVFKTHAINVLSSPSLFLGKWIFKKNITFWFKGH